MKNNNRIIDLKNISVSFDGEPVLEDLSLYIKDGEFVTFLGPSGCGKTTTLRVIAGFIEPDSGDVFFNSERINDVPPHKREVNTIFQRYALFPHLNVFDNIAYGLKIRKVPKDEIKERVHQMLKLVNLEGFEHRNIAKLSGGQQQRVAIARAVAKNPKLLLCDEPTGALDYKTGKQVLKVLQDMCFKHDMTVVMITHNSALADMGRKIIRVKSGQIESITINENPKSIEDIEY